VVRKPSRLSKFAIAAFLAGAPAWFATRKRGTSEITRPSGHAYKSKQEIKAELREVELEKRKLELSRQRFDLYRQAVLLALRAFPTMVLMLTTVYCVVAGVHWPYTVAAGSSGVGTAILAVLGGRRGKPPSDE
jgi:hypothetical protein